MQIGFILATVVVGNLAFLFEEIRLKTCQQQETAEDYKGKCSNREFFTFRLNFEIIIRIIVSPKIFQALFFYF